MLPTLERAEVPRRSIVVEDHVGAASAVPVGWPPAEKGWLLIHQVMGRTPTPVPWADRRHGRLTLHGQAPR
jgi:hypothetical protein